MKQDALVATLAVVLASTAGCGHVIDKHLRKVADKELTLPQVVPKPEPYHGALVIWGGYVLETQNDPDGSTVVVLETPLGGGDQEGAGEVRGRFLARTPDLLDPALFEAGRRVTVAGRIVGAETRPLGQTQYAYPVLQVEQIHLWQEYPPDYPYYDDYPYWHGRRRYHGSHWHFGFGWSN